MHLPSLLALNHHTNLLSQYYNIIYIYHNNLVNQPEKPIQLPYLNLASLLTSNIPTYIKPSYQPVIPILQHYLYISQQSSKPSCKTNPTSLSITPIYYPYLITNLLPLPVSNTPTCITTQHTHMYTNKYPS